MTNFSKKEKDFSNSLGVQNKFSEVLAVVCGRGTHEGFVICEKGVQGVCGSCSDKAESCVPDVMASRPSVPERFEVRNIFGALEGQVVRIGIPERSIWLSVVVSYLIPLLGLLIGASGSAILSFLWQGEIGEWSTIIGAFTGFLCGIALAFFMARYLMAEVWAPKMLGVLGTIKPCSDKKTGI